jgi:predicted dehydrogenase
MKPVRYGILGTANIARKNWKAILNSGNGRVVAVASRSTARSAEFVRLCQAQAPFDPCPRALGSYEELLTAQDVDAIYIPLPTGIRGDWVKRAAAAGKHVVCEKPCATSVAELNDMLDACRRHKVQFMDGVMFMHSQRLERMREVLDDDRTIGRIRRITSAFTFRAPDEFFTSNIRAQTDLEPYGCLGDLGWYCIRFALWAVNWTMPERVSAHALSEHRQKHDSQGVPTEFSAELFFPGGITSSFYCSFLTETEEWAIVTGELGHLRVLDFVLPFSGDKIAFETGQPAFEVRGCDFEMHPHSRRYEVGESSHSNPGAQESQLFRHFSEQIQSGTLNPLWPEIALKTQAVMQACHESSLVNGQPIDVGNSASA